jgi:hypothetical protein
VGVSLPCPGVSLPPPPPTSSPGCAWTWSGCKLLTGPSAAAEKGRRDRGENEIERTWTGLKMPYCPGRLQCTDKTIGTLLQTGQVTRWKRRLQQGFRTGRSKVVVWLFHPGKHCPGKKLSESIEEHKFVLYTITPLDPPAKAEDFLNGRYVQPFGHNVKSPQWRGKTENRIPYDRPDTANPMRPREEKPESLREGPQTSLCDWPLRRNALPTSWASVTYRVEGVALLVGGFFVQQVVGTCRLESSHVLDHSLQHGRFVRLLAVIELFEMLESTNELQPTKSSDLSRRGGA